MGAIIINQGMDRVWLALGETEILLRSSESTPKQGMRLVLYSDDVNEDRDRLREGKNRTQDTDTEDTFLVQDFDGRWLAVLEQPS